jgi:hypothetical protein
MCAEKHHQPGQEQDNKYEFILPQGSGVNRFAIFFIFLLLSSVKSCFLPHSGQFSLTLNGYLYLNLSVFICVNLWLNSN